MNIHEERKIDVKNLRMLLSHVNGAKSSLTRDECGDPVVRGRRGHVYSVRGAYYVHVSCSTRRQWTLAKQTLVADRVSQDGDCSGVLVFARTHRVPGAALRRLLGLRQTRRTPQGHRFAARGAGHAGAKID